MRALGLIETRGLVGALEASDAALKAAEVNLVCIEHAEVGLACVKLRGEVADVRAAVDAGAEHARRVGELVATHVIPSPDEMTEQVIEHIPEVSPTTGAPDGIAPRKPIEPKRGRKS